MLGRISDALLSDIAALRHGPLRAARPAAGGAAALPLLLCLAILLFAVAAFVFQSADPEMVVRLTRDAEISLAASLLCVVLAIPAALVFSPLWLVPLFIGVSVAAAGWGLLPLRLGPVTRVVETAGLLLPFMVFWVRAAMGRVPDGLGEAAAAAGAGRGAVFWRVYVRLVGPVVGAGWGAGLLLAIGLGVWGL